MGYFSDRMIRDDEAFGRDLPDLAVTLSREEVAELPARQRDAISDYRRSVRTPSSAATPDAERARLVDAVRAAQARMELRMNAVLHEAAFYAMADARAALAAFDRATKGGGR